MKRIEVIIPKELRGIEREDLSYEFWNTDGPEEMKRLMKVFKDHGYWVPEEQAILLWTIHSQDWAANWLSLPRSDEDLWRRIERYWKVK